MNQLFIYSMASALNQKWQVNDMFWLIEVNQFALIKVIVKCICMLYIQLVELCKQNISSFKFNLIQLQLMFFFLF